MIGQQAEAPVLGNTVQVSKKFVKSYEESKVPHQIVQRARKEENLIRRSVFSTAATRAAVIVPIPKQLKAPAPVYVLLVPSGSTN